MVNQRDRMNLERFSMLLHFEDPFADMAHWQTIVLRISWIRAHSAIETFKNQSQVKFCVFYCGAYFLKAVAWSWRDSPTSESLKWLDIHTVTYPCHVRLGA